VFLVKVIGSRDGSVLIVIKLHHDFISNKENIVTVPSSFTDDNVEWTVTIDMTIIWAVFISPGVFAHHDTGVDFTGIDSTIIVKVTVF
jgi:hypothetical protein